jgi:hypothetical protein
VPPSKFLEDSDLVFWVLASTLQEIREVVSCVSPSNFFKTGDLFVINILVFLEDRGEVSCGLTSTILKDREAFP